MVEGCMCVCVCAVMEGLGLCPNPPHRRGKGLCPSPSGCDHDAAEDPNGIDDGEPPNFTFPDDRPPSNAAAIEAELEMCTALATWEPWNTPSAALLQAMDRTQQARGAAHDTVDIATICERRAEAIKDMAYEEAHFANIPPSLRYQRLARIRLHGCPRWQRRAAGIAAEGLSHTHSYLNVCTGIHTVED